MIEASFYEEEEIVTYIQVENRSNKDRVCRVYVDGKMIGMAKIVAQGKQVFLARNYNKGSLVSIKG